MAMEIAARALKDQDAAKYIDMSESFLRQSRVSGNPDAPPFIKIGRAVRYLRDDLDKWLESHRRHNTVQEPSRTGTRMFGSDDEFKLFREAYPHKVARATAKMAFAKARKKSDLTTLLDGVDRYVKAKPPDQSWCNPATWLNGERPAETGSGTQCASRAGTVRPRCSGPCIGKV